MSPASVIILWLTAATLLYAQDKDESITRLHHKILELSNSVEECQIDLKNAKLYEVFDEKKKKEYIKQINELRSRMNTLATTNKRYEALLKERNVSLDTLPKPVVIAQPIIKKEIKPLTTKARVCKLKEDAPVYSWPEGEVVARWKEGTSFTSNVEYEEYVKVTGIFDKEYKWQKNPKEEWIKKEWVQIK